MADKAPVAEKPRDMTRDDRRIVFDKINGVYDGGHYIAPWTDAAVAKDLGVPRDWVAKVREEFFGPAGSNPLLDEYLSARDKVELRFKSVASAHSAVASAADAYRAEFAAATKEIEALRLLGKRIEREIGR